MIDPTMAEQLRGHFTRLSRSVRLVAAYDDSATSAEMRELLAELAALSDRISVVEGDGERRPSFSVEGPDGTPAVRFAGLPLGHEFTSLVLAVLQVGGHPPVAEASDLARIGELSGPLRFETFFSQSCQNCPDVVQALNALAVLNPAVSHVAIDGASFAAEAERRGVMAVPTVFMNGEPFAQGRMTLGEILDRLVGDASGERAAELSAREPYDVLIVGGGPAGVAAAVYSARKGIRTALVAERVGGQVLDTAAIENLVTIPATEGPRLAAELEANVTAHEVDLVTRERAVRLNSAEAPGGLASVELASGGVLRARSVVLATGARWRRMGVPGEEALLNHGVTFCPHCDGPLFKNKRVAVIGGGNSGVEAAIDLAGVVAHVTLIEFDTQLRADEILQRKLRSLANVDVVLNAETTRVEGESAMTGLVFRDRATGEVHHLEAEGVFVQIGLVPNTEWLVGAVELTARGEVVVDERGTTSVPGVFGAGDCTTVPFKQIVVAMGAGSTAALSAFDYLIRSSAPVEALAGAG